MRRKLASLLLAAALLPTLSLPALAAPEDGAAMPESDVPAVSDTADISYSGPLDPLTGLPAGSRLTGDDPNYITLREGSCGYDLTQKCYVNEIGSRTFTSSIPNGAILNAGVQSVAFTVPSGLSAVLYRNGDAVNDADLTGITEAGSYVLDVRESSSTESVSFSFQLLGELTGSVTEFPLPAGFAFTYVRLNGEELTTEYSNYTQLLEDGDYEICWSCPAISRRYTVKFTLDTVAPTLSLPEVVNGEAHSAVTVTDLEQDAYILLTDRKTGETTTILYGDTEIAEAGTYRLAVYDRAGNHTDYDFTIHVYLNISALTAIALVLAGIVSLCAYSRYIRKHPRVG